MPESLEMSQDQDDLLGWACAWAAKTGDEFGDPSTNA